MAMQGKRILITGSTDGIGRHTALKLARDGATVLVHGRSKERVFNTISYIREQTSSSNVAGHVCNLASVDAVRAWATQLLDEGQQLHTLINNAGVYEQSFRKSEDGYELTWAVNVLAPYLLTSLLLPLVTDHIINVSSVSASYTVNFSNLQQEQGYSAHGAYSQSKLCNQIFTMRLAQLLKPAGVQVNTLDPGTVNTKMLLAGWGRIGIEVHQADNLYKLAGSIEQLKAQGRVAGSGLYLVSNRQARAAPDAYDEGVQQRLWQVLQEQSGTVWPEL